ncbi:MAG: D-alanyl-D-alanine carboxypeptidase, partial [Rhodobacteraceae bacterium]|nr:D-alanyl-D-alanine carboxypeptidase [Paracoccaceae bacterium]
EEGGAGKTLRLVTAVASSPRPLARPNAETAAAAGQVVASIADDIAGAVAEANAAPPPEGTLESQQLALSGTPTDIETLASVTATPEPLTITAKTVASPVTLVESAPRPPKRRAPIYDEAPVEEAVALAEPAGEVITRVSTSGGRHWGINVGRFNTWGEADRALMKTQLAESATLGQSLRKVTQKGGGFDANFLGLGQDEAERACAQLQARGVQCFTMGP